jgi:hypothetical protein
MVSIIFATTEIRMPLRSGRTGDKTLHLVTANRCCGFLQDDVDDDLGESAGSLGNAGRGRFQFGAEAESKY